MQPGKRQVGLLQFIENVVDFSLIKLREKLKDGVEEGIAQLLHLVDRKILIGIWPVLLLLSKHIFVYLL